MDACEKKIGLNELKEKFIGLNETMITKKNNINKLQNDMINEQAQLNNIIGSMTTIGELMITILGSAEEAQKVINELQSNK
jgi:hypothetical protein